jgi:HAD superfamily hydrolase (TIGR01549 family)
VPSLVSKFNLRVGEIKLIKAVIFDVDGTLVDSVDLHARAWQEAFAHFGKQIPYERVRYQIGKGGDQLMPVFLSKEELEEFGDELEKYRGELFKREYMSRVRAFPEVRELFERINSDGKQIALASSAKGEELATYKKIANIEDLVEEETSKDDAEKSKPHPDIFEAALARLGDPKKSETIVVGDTPYDAEAAGKAGLRTIGFLCGGFPREDLRATTRRPSRRKLPTPPDVNENPPNQLGARLRRRRKTSRRPHAWPRGARPRRIHRTRARVSAPRRTRHDPATQYLCNGPAQCARHRQRTETLPHRARGKN